MDDKEIQEVVSNQVDEKIKGITFYICIGRFGGFGFRYDEGYRFVLGWVSIALIFRDIEMMMNESIKSGEIIAKTASLIKPAYMEGVALLRLIYGHFQKSGSSAAPIFTEMIYSYLLKQRDLNAQMVELLIEDFPPSIQEEIREKLRKEMEEPI